MRKEKTFLTSHSSFITCLPLPYFPVYRWGHVRSTAVCNCRPALTATAAYQLTATPAYRLTATAVYRLTATAVYRLTATPAYQLRYFKTPCYPVTSVTPVIKIPCFNPYEFVLFVVPSSPFPVNCNTR